MSYVFENKTNKSYEYDKKKEANISKIMLNFPGNDKIEAYHKKTAKTDKDGFNPTDGPTKAEQAERLALKKRKEMDAKLFQDK